MDITIHSTPLPGDIVDVTPAKQLPTRDIVVNMDGGVGGSWREVSLLRIIKNHSSTVFTTNEFYSL